MRILFTGGGGAATEALWKLLSPQHEVYFGDADRLANPGVTLDRWCVLPMGDEPTFIDALDGLCRSLRIDALIPGVDEELLPIAKWSGWFVRHVVLPDATFVENHLDKWRSNRWLELYGVPVPWASNYPFAAPVQYPCVLKPRVGRGSRNVYVVKSYNEAMARIQLSGRPVYDFVFQERLIGQEYTCALVADRTKTLRAVVPVRVDKKRGVTLRGVTVHDDAVIALCQQIHKAHPFSGIVNVQCIKQADGTVKPFEINPRISTTTCLAIAAGVDVIGLALSDGLAPFKTVTLRRSWQNEFV